MTKYQLTQEHLDRMLIPKLHQGCNLAAIPDTCAHKAHILKYIEDIETNLHEGVGLLLFGEYSSGKSALGSILLKAAATYGKIGLWVSAAEIPGFYINNTRFDADYTVIERAITAPLLVVDEIILFGDKRDWHFERLIRERIGAKRATVCTTNLSPKKFKTQYPALAAVLTEAVLPIQIAGHDFRADIREHIKEQFEDISS